MRVAEIKVYTFEELSPETQEKVLEKMAQNAVEYDSYWWFENMVEDAKESADFKILTINTNPIDGEGEFITNAETTADTVLENHGKECETYKTAAAFKSEFDRANKERIELEEDLENALDTDGVLSRIETLEEEIEELETQFCKDLAHDYASLYDKEIDYQTSEEALKETIEANEYEFLASGKMAGACIRG